MEIMVINGSPKGNLSVTLQFCRFLEKMFPEHIFKYFDVAQKLPSLERKEEKFIEIMNAIQSSDGLIWAFPVYVALVQSNLKRFIEKIFEKIKYSKNFKDKYVISLSTSIHYFDHTAHEYMRAISDDLEMRYVGKFSADMMGLPLADTQNNLMFFFRSFISAIENGVQYPRQYLPIDTEPFEKFKYIPECQYTKISNSNIKDSMIIITDYRADDSSQQIQNLSKMIEQVSHYCEFPPKVINLQSINIKGGCLGCCQCGEGNNCAYGDSDGYKEFWNSVVKPAQIILFAFPLVDRYFSSRVKMFQDRAFFNTHIPLYKGKQLGYIISGALNQNQHILRIIEGTHQVHEANVVGIVTDELFDSKNMDLLLYNLISTMIESDKQQIFNASTMLGVGGKKIFRDSIYGRMRFPFIADYKYYKKNGMFDFPKPIMEKKVLQFLYRFDKIKNEVQATMKEKMVASSMKVVEECEPIKK